MTEVQVFNLKEDLLFGEEVDRWVLHDGFLSVVTKDGESETRTIFPINNLSEIRVIEWSDDGAD